MHPPSSAGRILRAVSLLPLVTFLWPTSLCGQTTPPPAQASAPSPQPAPNQFAAEPYFIKSSSDVTTINADGTGTRLQTVAVAIQSDAALRQLSVITLGYSSQTQHADFLYARVVHPDGTIQETPVADAIEQPAPVTQQAPLYSDLETKQLPVKSMRIGDTLEWQARITTDHPEVPGQAWDQSTFATGAVVLDETYELRVPSSLHLTVWTNPHAGATFTESDSGGQHIYHWQHSDLHPTVGAAAEAAKRAEDLRLRTPDEELDAQKGALPSLAWTTFSDWAAVGAWYRGLVADRTAPDDAIRAKVAELTAGKTTDLAKAQAVYAFVSSHIRYVGVDFGIGRYQPHTAGEVFANQYGDCKDKHVLLASMLSVLNLHADPVLIGAGVRFNSAVPSPASFNHVITRLPLDGKDVWLDATEETGAWGALLKPIRDQDALLVPASAPALVAHTPQNLPYPQSATAVVVGSLDTTLTSDSKITLTFHDDDELYLRAAIRSISPSDYDTMVQRIMAGMGFGGTTSQPEIDHLEDPSQPLQIAFHYHRVPEKDWGENRITATFVPISLPDFSADQPPNSAIQLGSPRTETSTVEMQLPDGWSAQLPDAVHAHAPFATCDVTYSIKDHKLLEERRLTVLQSEVPVKDYKQYQTWYDDADAGSVPYIQLAPAPKVGAAATLPTPQLDNPPSAAKPSDPQAADLIQQAIQSGRSFDLDSARKLLDQAKAINPTEKGLWLGYAAIAQQLGLPIQVLQDMQRELSYHPEQTQLYPLIVRIQTSTGDSPGARATLRAWVKAAPDSPDAALALARLLIADKSPADALQAAQSAIARLKSSDADLTDLHLSAAIAQDDLGQTSQAADAVAPLLATVTDSTQINDIAYILAEASAHLTEAAAAESKAIADDEAATASWTLADSSRATNDQQAHIAAEWDTMALILLHQGKFTEALGYANAAIHSASNKDVHDHLTAINAVLHNPATTAILRSQDQQLRTFPLGPANGRQGVAPLTLLLASGKVLDSKPETSSSPALPNIDPLLKAANLKALFPPASNAHLLRTGFVNCHSGVCELVLAPLDGVQVIKISPTQSVVHLPVTKPPSDQ